MPRFIHDRAEHLLAKNPDMPEHMAWAVATQQSHSVGKNPKGYGTAKGKRVAKAKYDTPKDDVKSANPGHLESSKMASVSDELLKIAISRTAENVLLTGALGMGIGALTAGGIALGIGKRGRDQISREVHDPRLYSNLRGMLESQEERVAAHKHLKKGKHTVWEAMKEGFGRPGEKTADILPGGKGDNLPDSAVDPEQLKMGIKEEREHTPSVPIRKEIAKDHLAMDKKYYTHLDDMEEKSKKSKEAYMALELFKIAQFNTSQFSGPTGEGIRINKLVSMLPPRTRQPILVKEGFTTSQFSGPLSYGSFKQESPAPGFSAPSATVKMAPSPGLGRLADPSSSAPKVKAAAEGYGTTLPNITSPATSLSRTQHVGQGKIGPGPGPSVAEQVKPQNFGKGSPVGPTMPGAGKSIGGV